MEPLSWVFDMLQYFETILLWWKAFDPLNKMRYVLWWLWSWILRRISYQKKQKSGSETATSTFFRNGDGSIEIIEI